MTDRKPFLQVALNPSELFASHLVADYYNVSTTHLVKSLLRVAYLAYQRDSENGTMEFLHGNWPAKQQPTEGWHEYDQAIDAPSPAESVPE